MSLEEGYGGGNIDRPEVMGQHSDIHHPSCCKAARPHAEQEYAWEDFLLRNQSGAGVVLSPNGFLNECHNTDGVWGGALDISNWGGGHGHDPPSD